MPHYSKESLNKLKTCDWRLQFLFKAIIQFFDCKIVYGHRTPEEQFELFKIGRELQNGAWVIVDKSKIVTRCDGYDKLSKHNYKISLAVDVAPYPIDYKDIKRFYYLAGCIWMMGKIFGINVTWGGNWDNDDDFDDQIFNDLMHFEIEGE